MMNKYFRFTVESDLGTGTQYIEFDKDNWAIRQAECHDGRWFNSSKEKYHPELGGISLFDQQLTELGMERGKLIDPEEFELAWKLSCRELIIAHTPSKKLASTSVTKKSLETEKVPFLPKQFRRKNTFSNQKERKIAMRLLLSTGFTFAIILGLKEAIVNTNSNIITDNKLINAISIKKESISFECDDYTEEVIMVGSVDKARRAILKFDKKLKLDDKYSPINRCQMIANKISKYTKNDRYIAVTTGIKNGYDIICLSEGVGKGCLDDENGGQILTLARSGTHSSQKHLESLITSDSGEIRHFSTESTSSHAYINLYKLIKDGRDYYKINPS